jgi:hypothetical protein
LKCPNFSASSSSSFPPSQNAAAYLSSLLAYFMKILLLEKHRLCNDSGIILYVIMFCLNAVSVVSGSEVVSARYQLEKGVCTVHSNKCSGCGFEVLTVVLLKDQVLLDVIV